MFTHTENPVQMNFQNMSCGRSSCANIDRQTPLYDESSNSILGTNFFHRVVDFAVFTYKVEACRVTKMLDRGKAQGYNLRHQVQKTRVC